MVGNNSLVWWYKWHTKWSGDQFLIEVIITIVVIKFPLKISLERKRGEICTSLSLLMIICWSDDSIQRMPQRSSTLVSQKFSLPTNDMAASSKKYKPWHLPFISLSLWQKKHSKKLKITYIITIVMISLKVTICHLKSDRSVSIYSSWDIALPHLGKVWQYFSSVGLLFKVTPYLFISNSSAMNASLAEGGMQMHAVISHSFEIVSAWPHFKTASGGLGSSFGSFAHISICFSLYVALQRCTMQWIFVGCCSVGNFIVQLLHHNTTSSSGQFSSLLLYYTVCTLYNTVSTMQCVHCTTQCVLHGAYYKVFTQSVLKCVYNPLCCTQRILHRMFYTFYH